MQSTKPQTHAEESRPERVAILLGTYNGARFLREQLRSLEEQTHPAIDILASDDGSSDGTRAILEEAARSWGKGCFSIVDGPGRGFSENYRSLILDPAIDAPYVAFCDQDDIWLPDKLSHALQTIASLAKDGQACLYGSRTRTIDEEGHEIGLSPLFYRPPSFRNAIVQSLAGGNTMVMNRRAFGILAESCRRTDFVSHDWWTYLIVSGAGGIVHYDPEPRLLYRQHGNNVVGANNSLRARIVRVRFLLRGGFASWMTRNLRGLELCADLLDEDARATLPFIQATRTRGLPGRVRAIREYKVYRQEDRGFLELSVASILKKI
ncbi:glycosyltransferase family 2 protein [Aureimonas populi]|uniref:Glycosyltransferase family 2 protein n=1 Tax=Aureimonas populi TaxID=1701758 RepID=A0ABW5CJL6_9HYPH|nr:glycosyltransferase family 2 protein [Aureimonas populi]